MEIGRGIQMAVATEPPRDLVEIINPLEIALVRTYQ
jgi:hypothetical protein